MDIQHLLFALEIHNSGSISRAAQNLYVAQPNLSNAIRDLENELGITIFNRTNSGVTTTEEGLEFMQYARSIATRFESLQKRYLDNDKDSVISISSMRSSELFKRIINYINGLIGAGRKVNIIYRETSNANVIQDVINNAADIGILRANIENANYYKQVIETNQLIMLPLPTDCYVLLMSNKHPLAKESNITPEMLGPYTEIYYGDIEASWYPGLSKIHDRANEIVSSNILRVYDRSSFLDAVSMITGAYGISTPPAHNILSKYELIEKNYPGHIMESSEYIILKEGSLHNQKISGLLSILCMNV